MASVREMRSHIKTIENIGQMTRALQAVSASCVKQGVMLAQESRPYSDLAWKVMLDLFHCTNSDPKSFPMFADHEKLDGVIIVFISADRGLAGSFTVNVFHKVLELEKELKGTSVKYITVGRRGRDMLLRRNKEVLADFSDMETDKIKSEEIGSLTKVIIDEFKKGTIDRVYMVYTEYENVSHYFPEVKLLLPMSQAYKEYIQEHPVQEDNAIKEYIYEGDPVELIESLIPRIISRIVYHAILSSKASENTARMIAMSHASENAEELNKKLKLEYNKVRQQMITSDILDIIGGSQAQTGEADSLIDQSEHIIQEEE